MLKTTRFFAVLSVLLSALPAHACANEVPTISIESSLIVPLFVGASVLSLAFLGYMHLQPSTRLNINRTMGPPIAIFIGLYTIGALVSEVGRRVQQLQPTIAKTVTSHPMVRPATTVVRPVSTPMVHPVTTPMLVH